MIKPFKWIWLSSESIHLKETLDNHTPLLTSKHSAQFSLFCLYSNLSSLYLVIKPPICLNILLRDVWLTFSFNDVCWRFLFGNYNPCLRSCLWFTFVVIITEQLVQPQAIGNFPAQQNFLITANITILLGGNFWNYSQNSFLACSKLGTFECPTLCKWN